MVKTTFQIDRQLQYQNQWVGGFIKEMLHKYTLFSTNHRYRYWVFQDLKAQFGRLVGN